MASVIYNSFKKSINGTVNFATDTIKVMLVDDTYEPDIDTHQFIDDVTGEVTGTGYTAGGATLSNKSVTVDTTNDLAKYDADNITWANSTITAYGAVIYQDTGTPSTSGLIAFIDFLGVKSSSDGDFILQWHTGGIFTVS